MNTTARKLTHQYRSFNSLGLQTETTEFKTHEQAIAKFNEHKAYWTGLVDEQNNAKRLTTGSRALRMQSGKTWLRIYRGQSMICRLAVE